MEDTIIVELRYRGHVYRIEGGAWRGPDGHDVHLLTWITDDLRRQGAAREGDSDQAIALEVAERLGGEAEIIGGADGL